jgi:hypothetical protein
MVVPLYAFVNKGGELTLMTPFATVEPMASFSSLQALVFVFVFFSGATPALSLIDFRFFGAAPSGFAPPSDDSFLSEPGASFFAGDFLVFFFGDGSGSLPAAISFCSRSYAAAASSPSF